MIKFLKHLLIIFTAVITTAVIYWCMVYLIFAILL